MKGCLFKSTVGGVFCGVILFVAFSQASARTVQSLNLTWKFNLSDVTGAQSPAYNDAAWQSVCVPHTFQYTNYHISTYFRGIGWYRKSFTVNAVDTANKKYFLEFQGAMITAQVYVNGTLVTTHSGGFTPFAVDITANRIVGNNVVAVRMNNAYQADVPPETSGWAADGSSFDYCLFGGIYRGVNLVITDRLYVPNPLLGAAAPGGGTVVTSSGAAVTVKTVVKNEYAAAKSCVLKTTILDKNGTSAGTASTTQSIAAGATFTYTQTINVSNPALWSPTNPAVYTASTEVYDNTTLTDTYTTRFGIRTVSFVSASGFSLNGNGIKLLGVNHHQMFPYIGHSLPDHAQKREAKLLKDMGCNFIRLSHYPHNPAFLDACDSLGIMVWEEVPTWGPYNVTGAWKNHHYQDIREMIRRDRNHPCVIIWGVGNNEGGQWAGYEDTCQTTAKNEDPTGYTTTGRNYQTGTDPFDVYGNNFFTPPLPNSNPCASDLGYINSEHTGHTYVTHRYDPEATLIEQCRRHEAMTTEARTRAWVAGGTAWCAFDYNTLFNMQNGIAYHGVADLFRIPKFAYYFYKAQSAADNYNGSVHPMVFIESCNIYAMPSTQSIKIHSNCDQVELFVNGTSAGTRSPDAGTSLAHPPFTFTNVAYSSPGTLRADGRIGGVVRATQTLYRSGTVSKVLLESDTDTLLADGTDIARVVVSVADNNNMVPHSAANTVTVTASGAGRVICGSAGPVTSGSVTVEDGRLAFLVLAGTAAGTITVTATSGTLVQDQKTIVVVAPLVVSVREPKNRGAAGPGLSAELPLIRFQGRTVVFDNLNRQMLSRMMLVAMNGRVVRSMKAAGKICVEMQTAGCSPGVYNAVISSGGTRVQKNIFLVK